VKHYQRGLVPRKADPIKPGSVRAVNAPAATKPIRDLETTRATINAEIKRRKAIDRLTVLLKRNSRAKVTDKTPPPIDPLDYQKSETIDPQKSETACETVDVPEKLVESVPGKLSSATYIPSQTFEPSSQHLTDDERQVIEECANDISMFGALFLPHHLTSGYCQLHKDVYALLYGLLHVQHIELKSESSEDGPSLDMGGGGHASRRSSNVNLAIPHNFSYTRHVDNLPVVREGDPQSIYIDRVDEVGKEGELVCRYGVGVPFFSFWAVDNKDLDPCEVDTLPDRLRGQERERNVVINENGVEKKANDYIGEMPMLHGRDRFGNRSLEEDVREMRRWRKAVIAAPRGHAKAQSLDSLILCKSGWVRMGDLGLGDMVYSSDGVSYPVVGLHPIERMDLWKVRTRDGRETLCNDDHNWSVQSPSNTGDRIVVKTLRELRKNFRAKRFDKRSGEEYEEFRHFIPTCRPIDFPEKRYRIDPYTLGIWLGDGESAGHRIYSADPEIFDYIPYSVTKHKHKINYGIRGLSSILRSYGLIKNKHIPVEFLFGSIGQREALLQGLMDTDGYCQKDGKRAGFCTTLPSLRDGVVALVRSLGGTATVGEGHVRCNGKVCGYFCITIRLPRGVVPFRLSRKRKLWVGSIKTKAAIVSIQPHSTALGRCITVDSPDGTYITDDYLVTHNTTSLMVFMIWCVCYQMRKYIVLVSDSEDQTKMHLDSIKAELEVNERIRRCYGDLVGGVWGAEAIETSNGVRIQCRGAGQKVRGLKYRNKRPDLIIVDDLLNEDLVDSEERRVKVKKWFLGALLRCMSKDGAIIVTGTILHEADLLSDLLRAEAGWVKRRYEACGIDEDGKLSEPVLWPDLYKLEDLVAMREEYASEGEVSLFYREMFNRIVSNEASPFKREWFKYKDYAGLEDTRLTNYMFVDPAYTLKKTADFTAFGIVAVDSSRHWYIKAVIRGHWNIPGVIEQWFECVKTYRPMMVGIQNVDWDRVFKPLIEDEMRRRGMLHTVKSLQTYSPVSKGLSNKKNRISMLSKYYANGTIYHMRDGIGIKDLEGELLSHPYSKHDDMCFVAGTMVATPEGDRPIEDVFPGDFVLSPGGIAAVTGNSCKMDDVVCRAGLSGTSEHKVMNHGAWVPLSSLTMHQGLDTLTLWNLLKWKYRRLLNGMVGSITSWEREDITSATQIGGKGLRDSMSIFTSIFTKFGFREGLLFTIRTGIHTITTFGIWSVYRVANTARCILSNTIGALRWLRPERPPRGGIDPQTGELGTESTPNKHGSIKKQVSLNVSPVGARSQPISQNERFPAQASVTSESSPTKTLVYNLKTTTGVYYANKTLVSNCDAISMAIPVIFPPQEERVRTIPDFMERVMEGVDETSGY
jgi:hypothetical protein